MKVEIPEGSIQKKIAETAKIISRDFRNKPLTLVAILKGSICLVADLIRHLEIPFELEFIQCQSYGMAGTTPTDLTIDGVDRLKLEGRHVLLIDDILDTGQTLFHVIKALEAKGTESITTLVLLAKQKKRTFDVHIDHLLFPLEDSFVVGYGLDYKENYRGLKSIYSL